MRAVAPPYLKEFDVFLYVLVLGLAITALVVVLAVLVLLFLHDLPNLPKS